MTTSRSARVGTWLIIAGVSVWVPFFLLYFAGEAPEVEAFLPFHLAGVIPGFILRRWSWLRRLWRP